MVIAPRDGTSAIGSGARHVDRQHPPAMNSHALAADAGAEVPLPAKTEASILAEPGTPGACWCT